MKVSIFKAFYKAAKHYGGQGEFALNNDAKLDESSDFDISREQRKVTF